MLTYILGGLAAAAFGTAASTAFYAGRLGRRVQGLEQTWEQVAPELIGRTEVSQAFAQLAYIEEQRRVAAAQRVGAAPFPMGSPAAWAAQAPMGDRVPPSEPAPQAAPTPAEINEMMTRQLAALNEQLQRVTNRRG